MIIKWKYLLKPMTIWNEENDIIENENMILLMCVW